MARTLTRLVLQMPESKAPVYVLIASSMVAYNNAFEIVRPSNIADLQFSLAHSPYWKLLAHSPGTWIYELLPALPTTPASLGNHHF
jgi:hypothetical protein